MKKEKKLSIKNGKLSQSQCIALAFAFIGEHKDEFVKWVESNGGSVNELSRVV